MSTSDGVYKVVNIIGCLVLENKIFQLHVFFFYHDDQDHLNKLSSTHPMEAASTGQAVCRFLLNLHGYMIGTAWRAT